MKHQEQLHNRLKHQDQFNNNVTRSGVQHLSQNQQSVTRTFQDISHTTQMTNATHPQRTSEKGNEIRVANSNNNRSLTVVEERIQPSQIQKEVECLNEDIFKNLLEDDLKAVEQQQQTMPFSMPPLHRQTSDRLVSSSAEEEIQTFDHRTVQEKQYGINTHNNQPVTPNYTSSMSPTTPRRFPNPHDNRFGFPETFGVHFVDQPANYLHRTLSNGSSTASDEATSPDRKSVV